MAKNKTLCYMAFIDHVNKAAWFPLKTFWHWNLRKKKKKQPFVSFHVNDEQPSGGNHEINTWNHSSMDANNGLK